MFSVRLELLSRNKKKVTVKKPKILVQRETLCLVMGKGLKINTTGEELIFEENLSPGKESLSSFCV